jgi:hypothetical protein
MKKTISFRLFGLGSVPKKVLPSLRAEGIVVSDEGVPGWLVTGNVKGPGKRFVRRAEGFSGALIVTRARLAVYSYWKRQINVAVDDARLRDLFVHVPEEGKLRLSFEASAFRDGWQGVIEYRFGTPKARRFHEVLTSLGAPDGVAPHGASGRH